ncbi:MAG: hypothetical protein LCH35_12255 [Bacteroidetes bacterium]|uniref:hypothetical protein n=1 Tax=Flavobacterium sp. TaxID=239 RepID=UPI002FDA6DC5|nr:hypothetical protein [Bacteroidota bacterium]
MKKISFLGLLLFFSCTIPYDAETRLVFQTKVVNSNNVPLKNIRLNINVYNNFGYNSSSETISYGTSDENGNIRLVFPSPIFDQYKINISTPFDENLGFETISINNIEKKDFENFELIIPKIYKLTYEEAIYMSVNYFTTNMNKKIISSKIEGIYSSVASYYPENENYINQSAFFIKKNQSIQLLYEVKNIQSGTIESFSNEYLIGDENFETTINY